jgi:sn-glycerol 3-phosphate transport system permease protein
VLFLFPTLLILVVFLYFPAVEIITKSLTQSHARLPGREVFVCLQNYTQLVGDASYRNSFITTFMITGAIVLVSLATSLGIALLASQKVRGAYIYRTLLIWPYALSPVVAGAIFFVMFQQDSGLINHVLDLTFGRQLRWFTDASLARIMIVVASVWNILGFNILFYVAGLQTIPADLLESAAIDGANRFWRFLHITFPLLAPFTFFLLVTNVTYSFYGIYGVVDVLTQGGPRLGVGGASGATEVLIYRLYEGSAQAGSSAAQALVLFVMIAAITVMQFGYIERRVTYAE